MSWSQSYWGLIAVAGLVVLFVPSLLLLGCQRSGVYMSLLTGIEVKLLEYPLGEGP